MHAHWRDANNDSRQQSSSWTEPADQGSPLRSHASSPSFLKGMRLPVESGHVNVCVSEKKEIFQKENKPY